MTYQQRKASKARKEAIKLYVAMGVLALLAITVCSAVLVGLANMATHG